VNNDHKVLNESEIEVCAQASAICPSFNLRKSARAVSRIFDEALQPCGLRSGQLAMLLAVANGPEPTYAQLARDLVMDTSTIARSLRPLEREGLLEIVAGLDRRRKSVRLTPLGAERIRQAVPLWEKAQAWFNGRVGDDEWTRTLADLDHVLGRIRGY
jgi:DNA-binding MarR family transcriptional regulator